MHAVHWTQCPENSQSTWVVVADILLERGVKALECAFSEGNLPWLGIPALKCLVRLETLPTASIMTVWLILLSLPIWTVLPALPHPLLYGVFHDSGEAGLSTLKLQPPSPQGHRNTPCLIIQQYYLVLENLINKLGCTVNKTSSH